MTSKPPPGVLIYRDVYVCVQQLNDEDSGRLIRALLEYAFDGVLPDLQPPLSLAWVLIQPAIDRDIDRYTTKVLKTTYAAAVRELKRQGRPVPTYAEWISTSNDVL